MKPLILSVFLSSTILGSCLHGVAQASTYKFQHQVEMEMSIYKKDKLQQNMDYTFLFPNGENYFGVDMEMPEAGMKAKSIFDYDAMTMTTLMDHPSMKMGSQYDLNKITPQAETVEEKDGSMEKTGRTKDILGYICYEYVMESKEDGYAEVWITEDLDFENVYNAFSALDKKQKQMNINFPKGFLMELSAWPKGKGGSENLTMKVKNIHLNQPTSISTDGYSIMKLN